MIITSLIYLEFKVYWKSHMSFKMSALTAKHILANSRSKATQFEWLSFYLGTSIVICTYLFQ